MNGLDKTRTVVRSLDALQSLRSVLAYMRSMSVVFESSNAGGHPATIAEEIREKGPERLTEAEVEQLSSHCAQAAICTHLALSYTAVSSYEAVIAVNPALRYDKLDEVLEAARSNGLLESMRELRNAVFHVRPSTQAHRLVADILRSSLENGLEWNTLEDLLFEATEAAFRNPEALYQEKVEVLEEGFRRAVAFYEEHLADTDE